MRVPASIVVLALAGCSSTDPHPLGCVPGARDTCACPGTSTRVVVVCPASGVIPRCPCADDADGAVRDAGTPDAGGVCCPLTANEGCSGVNVSLGGWAPTAGACQTTTWFDGYPMTRTTDEHGCPVLRVNRDASLCGASVIDATTD